MTDTLTPADAVDHLRSLPTADAVAAALAGLPRAELLRIADASGLTRCAGLGTPALRNRFLSTHGTMRIGRPHLRTPR